MTDNTQENETTVGQLVAFILEHTASYQRPDNFERKAVGVVAAELSQEQQARAVQGIINIMSDHKRREEDERRKRQEESREMSKEVTA